VQELLQFSDAVGNRDAERNAVCDADDHTNAGTRDAHADAVADTRCLSAPRECGRVEL
jgi:hypothetical protein